MIRYLKQEEKIKTRKLYETCFPEDDASFVDYYYQYKTRENRILVMEEEEGEQKLQAMIHLNPYEFQIFHKTARVSYIVAVASDPSMRRQGKMAMVMKRALTDLAKEGQPFAFLIPANPKVYESSGFVFISTEAYQGLNHQMMKEAGSLQAAELVSGSLAGQESLTLALPEDIPQMAFFANAHMSLEYDVFPLRDAPYYRRMLEELKSQRGGFLLLKNQQEIMGIVSYGVDGTQKEIQEILVKPRAQTILTERLLDFFHGELFHISDMNYMVRILSIRRLVKLLSSERPISLNVQVTDDVIEENNGCFAIRIHRQGGSVSEIDQKETTCAMDIRQLAGVLFEKQRIFIREWV